jgi:TetR/AcrR family transcriptional regulator, transcriptional repressor for nem operon
MKTSKEEVLQKAMLVIWSKGYHHTSFADLKEACGIHKSHFFHYFPGGKEQLMAEILQEMHRQFIGMLQRISEDATMNLEQKIEKLRDKMLRFYTRNQNCYGCLMANTALEASGKDYAFNAILRRFFEDFIDWLSRMYREKYPAEQARQLAVSAVQDVEGAILLMKVFDDISYLQNALGRVSC